MANCIDQGIAPKKPLKLIAAALPVILRQTLPAAASFDVAPLGLLIDCGTS
jgi:hypothetical protein